MHNLFIDGDAGISRESAVSLKGRDHLVLFDRLLYITVDIHCRHAGFDEVGQGIYCLLYTSVYITPGT